MRTSSNVDVLSDLLARSRARGAAFSRTTRRGESWGFRFPSNATLAVHAILDGEMFGWVDDPTGAQRLTGGDVLLVRTGAHHLASGPDVDCLPWGELPEQDGDEPLTGDFFCGAYLLEGDLAAPLLDALPTLVRLRPPAGSALRVTIDLLAAETQTDAPGQQALLDRLLDVALVQALRAYFAGAGETAPGWFRAMTEPGLGDALTAIHAEPTRQWSVAELAGRANLSRTSFARRFNEVVGAPPLQYLTDWRMALAKERLRDGDDGLAAIAADVGYASEFSFAAAFKRHTGVAPGRWRAASRPVAA